MYYVLIMYTQSDQPSATPSAAEEEVDDTSGSVIYVVYRHAENVNAIYYRYESMLWKRWRQRKTSPHPIYLTLPSEAALAAFSLLNSAPLNS